MIPLGDLIASGITVGSRLTQRPLSPFQQWARSLLFQAIGIDFIVAADFLHSNPSFPSRELTGLIRFMYLKEALNTGLGSQAVLICYDTTLPGDETAREGGGLGLKVPFRRTTIPLLPTIEALYSHQRLVVPQESPVPIPQNASENWSKLMRHFEYTNPEHLASERILTAKKSIFRDLFLYEISSPCVLASNLNRYLKDILLSLEARKLPWLAVTDLGGPIISVVQNGTIVRIANNNGEPCPETSAFLPTTWREIFDSDMFVLPSLALYFLCLFAIPCIAHFGNSYGYLDRAIMWVRSVFECNEGQLSIAADGTNSIPVCSVSARSRSRKRKSYALYSLDHFLYHTDVYREMVIEVAETGLAKSATVLTSNSNSAPYVA
jgi:hypothetical protein